MREIPQHATLQQMREASAKLRATCRNYCIEPLPESAPWALRVDQAVRRVIYPSLEGDAARYICRNLDKPQPVQSPAKLSRWQSFKQWLGGNMRKV